MLEKSCLVLLCIAIGKNFAALTPETDANTTNSTIDETFVLLHSIDQKTLDKKLWSVITHPEQDNAEIDRLRAIDNLLEQGANPHAIINETTQATVIEFAFVHRKFDLLRHLLNPEYGDNINTSRHGRTLLQRALEDWDMKMIQFLLCYGAQWRINIQRPQRPTFLDRLKSFFMCCTPPDDAYYKFSEALCD